MAHHQVGRPRCYDRERWHGHSPSRGRARPPAVVRSPAPAIVCRCPQGSQGDLGSAWLAQSGRADRSLGPQGGARAIALSRRLTFSSGPPERRQPIGKGKRGATLSLNKRELWYVFRHVPSGGYAGDEGFTARWHHTVGRFPGRRSCPTGKTRKRKEIGGHSLASLRRCRASFHRLFYLARLAAHSCRRRHGSRSIRIGVLIHFALTAWRARLLPAAERQAVGVGGSARTKRTGCQSLSGHHPRPIGNVHTREAPAFAVCADNRFIASAGMSTCVTQGPTRMQSGTAHAWSHGNSGLRRVITPGSSRRLQVRRCGESGGRLWKSAEVDHRIPLLRVWNEYRDAPWPALLDYWGLPNLQVINRDAPRRKMR